MSYFVFHRRKNFIPVWNNIRGEYIFICGWTIPFEMSVLNNLNNSILRSNLGDYSPPIERLKGLKTFELAQAMLPLSGYTWSPGSLTSDAYETEGTTAKLSVRCSRNISQPGGGGGLLETLCGSRESWWSLYSDALGSNDKMFVSESLHASLNKVDSWFGKIDWRKRGNWVQITDSWMQTTTGWWEASGWKW